MTVAALQRTAPNPKLLWPKTGKIQSGRHVDLAQYCSNRNTVVESKKRPLISSGQYFETSKPRKLVSCHRLANFFSFPRGAISICRSDRRSDRAQRNESTFRRCRLLFQDNFPVELRHARIIGRVVFDLIGLGLGVAGPLLLFARRLRNA